MRENCHATQYGERRATTANISYAIIFKLNTPTCETSESKWIENGLQFFFFLHILLQVCTHRQLMQIHVDKTECCRNFCFRFFFLSNKCYCATKNPSFYHPKKLQRIYYVADSMDSLFVIEMYVEAGKILKCSINFHFSLLHGGTVIMALGNGVNCKVSLCGII